MRIKGMFWLEQILQSQARPGGCFKSCKIGNAETNCVADGFERTNIIGSQGREAYQGLCLVQRTKGAFGKPEK